jgi:polysaccharide biosynthesis/export protein
MLTTRTAVAVLAIQFAVALPAEAQQASTVIPAVAAPASVSAEYRVGRDDQLDILVFDVPDLTRTVQVDSAGQFTLPLVGRIDASGHTAAELANVITAKLATKYVKDPQVTVTVKQAVSQRVTVDGAVIKPGIYVLAGPTTLLQAIDLANGADPKFANTKKVAVFRSVNGQRQGQVFDLSKIQDGKATDPEVHADDIIVVAKSGTKSFFSLYGSPLNFLALAPLL